MDDTDVSQSGDGAAPRLNPNWQEALDKVMHTSLMARDADLAQAGSPARAKDDASDLLSSSDEEVDEDEDDDGVDEDDVVDEGDDASVSCRSSHSSTPSEPMKPTPAAPARGFTRATPPPPRQPTLAAKPPPPALSSSSASSSSSAVRAKRVMEDNRNLQREEKLELLGRLQYLTDEKGFKPFRVLGPDDALEDIRYEVFRAQRELGKKRNVKMMQKALVTVAAGMEMMNAYYNPLKLRLDGFSKSLLLSIREYDEIFEELHWKYCDAVSMPPELKLVMTLGSSMWFFHMSNAAAASSHPPDPRRAPPPPPTPATVTATATATAAAPGAPQRRMNGPRVPPVFADDGGGGAVPPVTTTTTTFGAMGPLPGNGVDMTSLLSGLGMVQTLMGNFQQA
jgi:hypothetical protein